MSSHQPKRIILGDEARQALLRGVNILAQAVGATLGPRGRNSIIEQHKVMSTYSSEFDALKKKLPHGSECEDRVRKPRDEKHAAAAE